MNVDIIEALLGIILTIVGFYVKRAYTRMDELEKELNDHRLVDVGTYVPRSEMQEFANQIRTDIQGMGNNLDRKLESIETHLRSSRSIDH